MVLGYRLLVRLYFGTAFRPEALWQSESDYASGLLLALNAVILAWRVASVIHAFFDGRYPVWSGRAGAAGLAFVLVAVVVPHGVANAWGSTAQATFAQIFSAGAGAGGPGA